MKRIRRRHERGVILVVALLLIVAGTVIAMAAMSSSRVEMMISGNQRSHEQLFDAAEAGIDGGIKAFFDKAPPWGANRPPFTDPPSEAPWGTVQGPEPLSNDCACSVVITDMHVSKRPPPGNDPGKWSTYYYRIRSKGVELPRGSSVPAGVRETEQVVGVVYVKKYR